MVDFTNDFNTDAVTGAAIQTSLDELNTGLGNITDSNFKAGAAIASSRLGSISVAVPVSISLQVPSQIAGGWPGGNAIVGVVPINEGDILTGISWICDDIGGGAGVADIEYGYFNAAGAWQTISSIATISFADKGGGTGEGDVTFNEVTLASGADIRALGIKSTTADATMLTGADGKMLSMTFHFTRELTI